ncbi:MAG: MBOAT family protein [Candidatus Omnitrophica bacterium]|nr:MBOAT family protein [Candidatus Omnitrophota bacterium]
MLFNSIEFLLFFLAAALTYFVIPGAARGRWLLFLSCLFYAFWSVWFLIWLVVLTGLVYAAAGKGGKKALMFILSVILLNLIFFKYAPHGEGLWSRVLMPLGISYYTFKMISYVLDVYWEKMKAQRDFWKLALYFSFFPQILCGPIQRSDDFFAEIQKVESQPSLPEETVTSGLKLMLFGFFKKLVIADTLAIPVNQVFGHPADFNAAAVWIAVYCFTLQLFADFSGLTDIAIGVARVFGIQSPPNFNRPFYAPNIQEFWRRWHMTLTSWILDYVFKPLQMATRYWGRMGLVVSLCASMMAIGIWHGATTNFIVFGVIQSIYMSVSAITLPWRNKIAKKSVRLGRVRSFVTPMITFHLVVFSFVFIRARSAEQAAEIFRRMFQGDWSFWQLGLGISQAHLMMVILFIVLMELVHWTQASPAWRGLWRPRVVRYSVYYAALLSIVCFGQLLPKDFIYFKF